MQHVGLVVVFGGRRRGLAYCSCSTFLCNHCRALVFPIMDDLQKSWAQLSLTEAEQVIIEDDEGLLDLRISHRYFLVDRLFSNRPFNSQALINTMRLI